MKLEKRLQLAHDRITHARTMTEYVASIRHYSKLQNRYEKVHGQPYSIVREIMDRNEGLKHD